MAPKYVNKFSFPRSFGFHGSASRPRMAGGGPATAGSIPQGEAVMPGPSPAAEMNPLTRTPTAAPMYGNQLDDAATTDIDSVMPTRAGSGSALGSLRRSVNERNMKGNKPAPTLGAAKLSPAGKSPLAPKGALVSHMADGGSIDTRDINTDGRGIMYLGDPAKAEAEAQRNSDAARADAASLGRRRTWLGSQTSLGATQDDMSDAASRSGNADRELQDVRDYRRKIGKKNGGLIRGTKG